MTPFSRRPIFLVAAIAGIAAFAAVGCVGSPAAPSPTLAGSALRPATTLAAAEPSGANRVSACVVVYPVARCEAMLTAAAETLGVADDDVTAIAIAPDPTPRTDGILETLGGARPITVLAEVAGKTREVAMCGGIPSGPPCMNEPTIEIASPIGAGYEDVPCTGEPPDGCPKPLRHRDAAAIAAAEQLRIDRRVIPISSLGRQEVRLGTATIPNGVLTVAQGHLEDPWPDGARFSSAGLALEVRSLVAGRPPFRNLYEHGWWPGTEAVEVFLVFEVRHVEPGAMIEVRDIVVG